MGRSYLFNTEKTNKTRLKISCFLAVAVLLMAGAAYRTGADRLELVTAEPVKLSAALNTFPLAVKDWIGKDVPIPENIQRVTKNDDFINRLYINESKNKWANVYVAYSGRPRTMLGHRPEVCYVAGGWVHDTTEKSQFITSSGKAVPTLIHRFHKPAPQNDVVVVLNYYIVNGRFAAGEKGFSGLAWRTPNLAGNPARYVSQIQISSVLENSVLAAARDLTDQIKTFFPDEQKKLDIAKLAVTDGDLEK